jgi:hypothetical protein
MPSVSNKPCMLNVVMLNVVMLNDVMLNVVMLNVVMLSAPVIAPLDENKVKTTIIEVLP